MVIDKNLLSKKSVQESADELFGPFKAKLIRARGEFENFVANNQEALIESIDNCVKEAVHNNNRVMNLNDSITFDVIFNSWVHRLVDNSKSIDFESSVSNTEIEYVFNTIYHYEIDKNLLDISTLSADEYEQLKTNCEKYLTSLIDTGEIEVNDKGNTIDVDVNVNSIKYLFKAANDFSRFVVVYLAKQGIKSRANQSNNKVTVVIERDTDTGGFEDI